MPDFQMIFASLDFISRGRETFVEKLSNFYTPLLLEEEKNQDYRREIFSDIH